MWEFYTTTTKDNKYFDEVFEWYQSTPRLLKECWQFEEDKNQFVIDLKKGLNFVGIKDGIFTAMVHGAPKSEDIIEGHLFCLPGTDIDFVTMLVTYSKNQGLLKYKTILTQTAVKHKTMLEINKRAGFLDTGYRSWGAVHKGQLIEIQHNIASK
jgi:hypothetical protein